MQKIIIEKPGGFNRLKLVEESSPKPALGEVRVRTQSIGVNFADVVVRLGLYPSAKEYVGWPITPGFEFAGVVEELGEGVSAVSVGDSVFGVARFGAYASELTVPETHLFPLPKNVGVVNAGVIPVASLTAYYALIELGAAKPGHKVLVHSAAGGVGSMLVRIAKILGCEVVGVVGASHKVEVAKDSGCDWVIDKSQENWAKMAKTRVPDGFHLVLDANGAETLRSSYRLMRPTGRLIVYGAHTMLTRGSGRPNWLKLAWDFLRTPRFDPLSLTNDNKSVLAFNLSYLFEETELLRSALGQISDWYEEGSLVPGPVESLPLSEAARAHEKLQGGATVGKLTLVPSEN